MTMVATIAGNVYGGRLRGRQSRVCGPRKPSGGGTTQPQRGRGQVRPHFLPSLIRTSLAVDRFNGLV
jgi:hypothetical protein